LTIQLAQAKGATDASMVYTLYFRGLAIGGSAVNEGTFIPTAPQFYSVRNKVGQ